MKAIKQILWTLQIRHLLKNKCTRNEEKSMEILSKMLPERITPPSFIQETKYIPIVDVMLIIPVYNVDAYLEECICSILNQKTKYTYVAVFVDDGSSDNSATILNTYESDPRVKVIYQSNSGLSAARNAGMRTIQGRYIMFVDSDDILPENSLEKLLNIAIARDADIVEGSHATFSIDGTVETIRHGDSLDNVRPSELFGYAWGKVIRTEVMVNTCFPTGYLYEDTIMATLVHPSCKSICTISDIVYQYRLNPKGIDASTVTKKEVLDTFWITKYCIEEAARRDILITVEREKQYFDQIRLNWIRLKALPEEIQESVFIQYCNLYQKYFYPCSTQQETLRYTWIRNALKDKSYCAYIYLMKRWKQLDL